MFSSTRHVFSFSTLAALLLAAAAIKPALAAPGGLDPTFNGGVPAIIDETPSAGNTPYTAAVNPVNGDILQAGAHAISDSPVGQITAYKPDGSLDENVGTGGKITLSPTEAGLSDDFLIFYSIAVDDQGRILAAGEAFGDAPYAMVLARFKPNGTLDTNFGDSGTGIVTERLNTLALGTSLALTADGHILVTGAAANASVTALLLTVWRYNSEGMTDISYGDTGHVQVAGITTDPTLYVSALQADGELIAGCQTLAPGGGPWKLTRLMADGSPDTSFGASGFVTGAANQELAGLALSPDGGFVVSEYDGESSQANLRRYNTDGSVATDFNGGNPVNIGTFDTTTASLIPVAVQPDGKVLASANGGGNRLGIGRANPDGAADTGFGSGGTGSASVNFAGIGGNDYMPYASALLLQGDGSIVVSGYADSSAGSGHASFVTRVLNDTIRLTPAAISFMDQTGVGTSVTVTSNAVTISGLTDGVSVPVSVSDGEYKSTTVPGAALRDGPVTEIRSPYGRPLPATPAQRRAPLSQWVARPYPTTTRPYSAPLFPPNSQPPRNQPPGHIPVAAAVLVPRI